jgi:hypothetical protein
MMYKYRFGVSQSSASASAFARVPLTCFALSDLAPRRKFHSGMHPAFWSLATVDEKAMDGNTEKKAMEESSHEK